MTYKSKIGVAYSITLAVCAAMTVGSVVVAFVWATWLVAGIAVILALFLVFYLVPGLRNTIYELQDNHLFIKSGRYKIQIPYSNILSISSGVRSMVQAPAVSFTRIEIKYKLQTGAIEITHISPANESEFVSLLESKISA